MIVDSYEQPRERPTDYKDKKKYNYSCKQKKPSLKNKIVVMPNGKEIVDVVVGETGATADIKIWRSRRKEWNPEQKFQGDKAYVGELLIDTPHIKTRSKNITDAQKRANKQKARKKIIVEHMIRLVKNYRVAAERFRLKSGNYEPVIRVVCGLIRWRIGAIVICQ